MRCANVAFGAGLALACLGARADSSDPLAHADVVSAIGVAHLADAVGDERLSEWLAAAERRDLTLVAVRAAPFAFAPERLVPGLARQLCGRDPVLAPEAAVAIVQIAERLRPSELEAREALRGDLRSAADALRCFAEAQPAVRADFKAAGLLLQARLAELDQPR